MELLECEECGELYDKYLNHNCQKIDKNDQNSDQIELF